jgi:hypothetical protein
VEGLEAHKPARLPSDPDGFNVMASDVDVGTDLSARWFAAEKLDAIVDKLFFNTFMK